MIADGTPVETVAKAFGMTVEECKALKKTGPLVGGPADEYFMFSIKLLELVFLLLKEAHI